MVLHLYVVVHACLHANHACLHGTRFFMQISFFVLSACLHVVFSFFHAEGVMGYVHDSLNNADKFAQDRGYVRDPGEYVCSRSWDMFTIPADMCAQDRGIYPRSRRICAVKIVGYIHDPGEYVCSRLSKFFDDRGELRTLIIFRMHFGADGVGCLHSPPSESSRERKKY